MTVQTIPYPKPKLSHNLIQEHFRAVLRHRAESPQMPKASGMSEWGRTLFTSRKELLVLLNATGSLTRNKVNPKKGCSCNTSGRGLCWACWDKPADKWNLCLHTDPPPGRGRKKAPHPLPYEACMNASEDRKIAQAPWLKALIWG